MKTLKKDHRIGMLKSHVTTVRNIKKYGLLKASGIEEDAVRMILREETAQGL